MADQLKRQWLALWQRIGAKGDPLKIFDDLVARYSEPHRVYHTLEHIRHCLREFEQVRGLATNPDAIELAIWYHDAVYAIEAKHGDNNKSNEENSADLAMRVCETANSAERFSKKVTGLILATRHNRVLLAPDKRLMADIDLSILGQEAAVFDEYERQIRKEYEQVPFEIFARTRSEILCSFIPPQRQFIYSTDFFIGKYERQARTNIIRSLERLKASP